MKKIVRLLFVVIALMLITVTVVGAQDTPPVGGEQPKMQQNRPIRELVQLIAQSTGLTPREVAQQVRDGSTLADLITTNGGDVQTVIGQAVASITERINQSVADGKLTQERADQLLTQLTERVTQAINGELRPRQANVARPVLDVLRLASDQTGLTVREIIRDLHSGKSLADILTEHSVQPETFISSVLSELDQRLDQAVTNGRLTREEADQRHSQFEERLRERINQVGGVRPQPEQTI
ncbi:MAG: hypothetical protein R3E39_06240 [Anaerolineae bacterium]